MDINLIRLICSFCAGSLLSMSGTLIQGSTQNELAGPSTLGINAFVVAIILVAHGINFSFSSRISLEYLSLAIFFALFVLLIVSNRIKRRGQLVKYGNRLASNMTFYILLGLGFNLFIGALFSVIQFLFMTMDLDFPAELWYGNFRFTNGVTLSWLMTVNIIVYFYGRRLSQDLRVLSFGNELAVGMRVDVEKVQRRSIYLAILAVGVVTSLFGLFAFVGLIFPHLLRVVPYFKSNIRNELILGGPLCGVIFSILDLFCAQCDIKGAEVPVGMVSAVLGSMLLFVILSLKAIAKDKG